VFVCALLRTAISKMIFCVLSGTLSLYWLTYLCYAEVKKHVLGFFFHKLISVLVLMMFECRT